MLEMKIVLQAAIERVDVRPGYEGPVFSKRRAITLSPRSRATTVLYRRRRQP